MGDVAAEVKGNVMFESSMGVNAFKVVAIYGYPWWENFTSCQNRSEPIDERLWSASICLYDLMPYGVS